MTTRTAPTTFTATALTFDDSSDNTIAYSLTSGDLLRNGDLLARNVTSLSLDYWKSDGTAASAASDLHLVEIDLTVQSGAEPYRLQTAVFPRTRVVSFTSGSPLDEAGSAATAIKTPGETDRMELDLISTSSSVSAWPQDLS